MIQSTSLEAFFAIHKSLTRLEHIVLKAIRSQPNVTDRELSHMLDWSINRITPRRGELVEKGMVEEAGRRKCRIGAREVMSWRAVPMPSARNEEVKPVEQKTNQPQLL
jgi:predicted HTH transcriptional regulator